MTEISWKAIQDCLHRFSLGERPASGCVRPPLSSSLAQRRLLLLDSYIDRSLPNWDNTDCPMQDEDDRQNYLRYSGGGLTTNIVYHGNSRQGFFQEEHLSSGPASLKGVRFGEKEVTCVEFTRNNDGVSGTITTYDRSRPGWNLVEDIDLEQIQ